MYNSTAMGAGLVALFFGVASVAHGQSSDTSGRQNAQVNDSAVPSQPASSRVADVSLTPAEMRTIAFADLAGGNPARALALSEALLLRDADDAVALRIGAQAALELGEPEVAFRHARSLYLTTTDARLRFEGARIAALALAQQQRFTRAQLWLRRARQAAPSVEDAAAIADDYQVLRQHNPLQIELDFGYAPSSNVNNGSSSDTIEFLGLTFKLSPEAQQLSGHIISASAGLTYRLNETARSRTSARLAMQARRHTLSPAAREAAPNYDVSNLDLDQVTLTLSHQWASPYDDQPASLSIRYGQLWLGGEGYSNTYELSAARRWRVDDRTGLVTSLSFGRTAYTESDSEADHWDGTLQWIRDLENGHRLSLSVGAGQTLSELTTLAHDRQSLSLGYDMGRVTDHFDISVGLTRGWRTYGPTFFEPAGRSDINNAVTLSVGLPEAGLYGFNPVITLRAQRNASTASRFESETLGMDIGFQSSF